MSGGDALAGGESRRIPGRSLSQPKPKTSIMASLRAQEDVRKASLET